MLLAFDLPNSAVIAMLLLAVSAVSMVIPFSPGFVDVYHALVIETLVVFFGAASGPAASFAVTTHLLLFVPPVMIGISFMAGE